MSDVNSNPASWDNWTEAIFNGISDITGKPEYKAIIGNNIVDSGTYYYATKFQLNETQQIYGGYSNIGGGFWDGIDNISGVLTVVEQLFYFPVTFTVVNNQSSINQINIKGSFNDWAEETMINSSSNVWTKTFDIPIGTYEWGITDQNSQWIINGPNLVFSITSEGEIIGQTDYEINGSTVGSALVLERWILLKENENTNIITGESFNDTNFGVLTKENTLALKGGAVKTFKDGDYDIVGATLFYSCHKDTDIAVDFTPINLPWKENNDAQTQVWENITLDLNLLNWLDNGNYVLDIYFEIYYKTDDMSEIKTIADNNNGNNYKAYFTYSGSVGTENIEKPISKIVLYPNPAKENIYIRLPESIKKWHVALYNNIGQQVVCGNNLTKIIVSDQPEGIYHIVLIYDKQIICEKVMINNH